MQDLTKRNMGIYGKADEIERQLRGQDLEVNQKGKERQRVDWADIDADEPINDMTYMNLGGSVQIEYPQEEQREEQRRHGGENHVGVSE